MVLEILAMNQTHSDDQLIDSIGVFFVVSRLDLYSVEPSGLNHDSPAPKAR